jgi:dTDP-4-dehydrorhamnose reductase
MINCELPGEVAKICSLRGIKFVQISTDHYVNNKDTKILETDTVSSTNQYSFTKLSAEKLVLSLNPNAMILRTNFFHFNLSDPQTFLDNLILNCKNNIITHSFSDVWFSPVSTRTLVLYLKKLLEIDFSGLINVSSNEIISKYEFHQQVLNCFGVSNNSHKPISVTKVSLKALRPRNMSLDNSKLIKATKVTMPSIYDMIKEEI